MTDVQTQVTTARVKVTMRELGHPRTPRQVTAQLNAISDIFDYSAAANEPGLTVYQSHEGGYFVGHLFYEVHIESITLRSPLTLYLTAAYPIAIGAMRILTKYHDLRVKRSTSDTDVLEEQYKQDVIQELRRGLRESIEQSAQTTIDQIAGAAETVDDMSERTTEALGEVAAIEIIQSTET